MKNIYRLLFLLSLTSCQQEELPILEEESLPTENKASLEEINFDDLPHKISYFFANKNSSTNKNSEGPNPFGKIRRDMPAKKIITKEGIVSYTLVLETKINSSSMDPFYFDNLVVYEKDKGDDVAYIVRYIPTRDWYNNSKDFNDFAGTIIFYAPNGEKINDIEMIAGEMRGSGDTKRRNLKVACALEMERGPDFCVGNLYGGGETCTSTYTYTWTCTLGGGEGGDSDPSDPGPEEPGSLPSTGGGGPTIPTIPEEPEEEVVEEVLNEIQNPCASQIFNQLYLLSTNYELPEIVDVDPDFESLKFSQAILNMFNEITNTDYIVQEQFMSDPELSGYTDPDPLWNSATGRYEITTYLSSQYLSTATRLSAARSMIHESIHAYLVYQQRLNPSRNVYDVINSYAEENGFPSNLNLIHHNFMAQFVNSIAYNLYLWDKNHGTGGNLGWQYYHDMAWGGVANYRDPNDDTKTLFYAEFEEYLKNLDDPTTTMDESSGVKERILNTIKNEATNNSNAKGDDCS